MQKAEVPHSRVQSQPAVRQSKGASLESPQGWQIAQLEVIAESALQAGRLAQLEAMGNDSPAIVAQSRMLNMIHNSPYITAQRRQLDSLTGEIAQRKGPGVSPTVQMARAYDNAAAILGHNPTWYATNPSFTDQQKIDIAQWIEDQNNTSPTIRPALIARTIQPPSDPAATYTWTIATHMDLAGPAHGGKDTPHAQIARNVQNIGQTTMAVTYSDGRPPINANSALPADDTAEMTFPQSRIAMNSGNLPGMVVRWAEASIDAESDAHAGRLLQRGQNQGPIDTDGLSDLFS